MYYKKPTFHLIDSKPQHPNFTDTCLFKRRNPTNTNMQTLEKAQKLPIKAYRIERTEYIQGKIN